jgi:hypothetical protein
MAKHLKEIVGAPYIFCVDYFMLDSGPMPEVNLSIEISKKKYIVPLHKVFFEDDTGPVWLREDDNFCCTIQQQLKLFTVIQKELGLRTVEEAIDELEVYLYDIEIDVLCERAVYKIKHAE